MNHTYRIIIEPDVKGFHGYVPALKGCHTWGKTIPETKHHLQEAIEVYLESLLGQGGSIPEEKSYESFATVFIQKMPTSSKVKQRSSLHQGEYAQVAGRDSEKISQSLAAARLFR